MTHSPVSRETGLPPAAALALAGARIDLLTDFASLLATEAVTRGLIGPREVPGLWERHVVNCALVAQAAPPGVDVADVGSGAGLPGVVWAICRPDLRLTLVEPLLRRVTFLHEVVERLGLERVEVVRARAEELHGERRFDIVTSRAVAPLDRLSGWCLPLVRIGGSMVALKGASAGDEIRSAAAQITRLGGGSPALVEHRHPSADRSSWAVHIERLREGNVGQRARKRAPRTSAPRHTASRRSSPS